MDLRLNRLFRFAFLLIIMTLLCILFTGFSYANSTATITLEGYTYSYYDDGTKPEYNMHGVFSSNLGNPVYCGNHAYPAPTGSDIGSSITKEMNDYHDSLVRKILYYGYKGPKEWSGFSNSEYNDVYRAYDHEGKTHEFISGIGTFCHEYSHTLGLPDFYDTDYEDNGGVAAGMWTATSLMDGGNYNNLGNRVVTFRHEGCVLLLQPQVF